MICWNVSGFQDILVQIDNWSSYKWRSSQNELWEAMLVRLNGDLGRKGDCLLLLILSLLLVSNLSLPIIPSMWNTLMLMATPSLDTPQNLTERAADHSLWNEEIHIAGRRWSVASLFLGGFRLSLDPKRRARQPPFSLNFSPTPNLHSSTIFSSFTHFSTLHWTLILKPFYQREA